MNQIEENLKKFRNKKISDSQTPNPRKSNPQISNQRKSNYQNHAQSNYQIRPQPNYQNQTQPMSKPIQNFGNNNYNHSNQINSLTSQHFNENPSPVSYNKNFEAVDPFASNIPFGEIILLLLLI